MMRQSWRYGQDYVVVQRRRKCIHHAAAPPTWSTSDERRRHSIDIAYDYPRPLSARESRSLPYPIAFRFCLSNLQRGQVKIISSYFFPRAGCGLSAWYRKAGCPTSHSVYSPAALLRFSWLTPEVLVPLLPEAERAQDARPQRSSGRLLETGSPNRTLPCQGLSSGAGALATRWLGTSLSVALGENRKNSAGASARRCNAAMWGRPSGEGGVI